MQWTSHNLGPGIGGAAIAELNSANLLFIRGNDATHDHLPPPALSFLFLLRLYNVIFSTNT
jgi:hypothetical protein